jgi:hypothetical protein
MQVTHPPKRDPEAKLPEVALDSLPTETKDYLISLHAATGRPIAELIRDILNRMAGAPTRKSA